MSNEASQSIDDQDRLLEEQFQGFKVLTPGGYLQAFYEELAKITVSKMVAECVAISGFSLFCNKMYFKTRRGKIKPNTSTMIVGTSGFSEKTTAVSPLEDILRNQIYKKFSKNDIIGYEKVKDEDGNSVEVPVYGVHNFTTACDFSPEGLLGLLSKEQPNSSKLMWIDEIASFLAQCQKQYMAGVFGNLCKISDGKTFSRYTQKNQLETVTDPYVVFFSAATEFLFETWDKSAFVQGWGNRLEFAVIDINDSKDDWGMEEFDDPISDTLLPNGQKDLVDIFKIIYESKVTRLTASIEAKQLWLKYRNYMNRKAKKIKKMKKNNFEHAYIARVPVKVWKKAIIQCVNRNLTEDKNGFSNKLEFEINENDVKWAIGNMERHVDHFYKLISMWVKPPKNKETVVITEDIKKVLGCFDGVDDDTLTTPEIQGKTHWSSQRNVLHEILQDVVNMGYLESIGTFTVRDWSKEMKIKHNVKGGATPCAWKINREKAGEMI